MFNNCARIMQKVWVGGSYRVLKEFGITGKVEFGKVINSMISIICQHRSIIRTSGLSSALSIPFLPAAPIGSSGGDDCESKRV